MLYTCKPWDVALCRGVKRRAKYQPGSITINQSPMQAHFNLQDNKHEHRIAPGHAVTPNRDKVTDNAAC